MIPSPPVIRLKIRSLTMEPSSKEGCLFSDDYRTGSNPFYHFLFEISKETQLTATEFDWRQSLFKTFLRWFRTSATFFEVPRLSFEPKVSKLPTSWNIIVSRSFITTESLGNFSLLTQKTRIISIHCRISKQFPSEVPVIFYARVSDKST